jgi:hypothetical protein
MRGRKNEMADFILNVEPVQVVGGMDKCWEWQGGLTPYGRMSINGETRGVHRIAYAYSRGRSLGSLKGKTIMHTCDNPSCCRPSHLVEGTANDNKQDSVNKERHCFGERSNLSKLCEDDIRSILMPDDTTTKIAEKFGVTDRNIRHIKSRRTWKLVKNVQVSASNREYASGEGNGFSKLREDDVIFILRSDMSGPDLAKKFGVTRQNIYHIKKRKIWKHVKP